MKIAIITGASSGIGREFALQIDSRYTLDEIWLIARTEKKLQNAAAVLKTKARVLNMDLRDENSYNILSELLKESGAEIKILVNAAGFGKFGSLESVDISDVKDMADVNVKALTAITKICIPYMEKGAGIVNMSSVSAFPVMPYIAQYAASKAYVLQLSLALSEELKDRGIAVTAVCPYWVESGFIPNAQNSPKGDAVENFAFITYPFPVVKKALSHNEKGIKVSLFGCIPKITKCLSKILPYSVQGKLWNGLRRFNF